MAVNTEDRMSVPYIAFEASAARSERIIKRLVAVMAIAVILLFVSNALWVWAWMQYDYISDETVVETTTQQDGSGVNIIGGGDINYGAESDGSPHGAQTYTDP